MPTFLKKENNAKTNLSALVTEADTGIIVKDVGDFPISGDFMITIWNKNQRSDPGDDVSMEIMRVTAVSGNQFTVTRGQEDTTPKRHNSGCAVELLFTVGQITELEIEIQRLSDEITGESLWDLQSGTNTLVPTIDDANLNIGSGQFTGGDLVKTRSLTIGRTNNLLTSVTKTGGRTLTATRDSNNNITSITDTIRTWTLTRNGNNKITGITII